MKKCSNKNCERSGLLLDYDQFNRDRTRKSGFHDWCKMCLKSYREKPENKKRKKYIDKLYSSNIERINKKENRRLMKAYNISLDEYNLLLKQQDYRCKICKIEEVLCGKKGLVIDHNHNTGKVRSLLCSTCNTLLGHARENTQILKEAIVYLENDLKEQSLI